MGFGGDLDEDCAGRGFIDHDWIVFGQCEGRSGCYVGAAVTEQVGFGGSVDETARAEGSSTMTGSPSGNAKVDLVATPGQRPRNRWVLVATWMKTAWAEGSSIMTVSPSGNAKVDLVGTPGRRPRVGGVCCGVLVGWCRVGG